MDIYSSAPSNKDTHPFCQSLLGVLWWRYHMYSRHFCCQETVYFLEGWHHCFLSRVCPLRQGALSVTSFSIHFTFFLFYFCLKRICFVSHFHLKCLALCPVQCWSVWVSCAHVYSRVLLMAPQTLHRDQGAHTLIHIHLIGAKMVLLHIAFTLASHQINPDWNHTKCKQIRICFLKRILIQVNTIVNALTRLQTFFLDLD